jgi:glutamine amidotransferase
MIVVVDSGMGNVGSIVNMLKKVGSSCRVSAGPDDIMEAGRLILPGVGAFDAGMRNLRERNLIDALSYKVMQAHTPIMGICLGMQLFSDRSEEGCAPGLGWIDAETVRLRAPADARAFKVPHMGWNDVRVCRSTPLFSPLDGDSERRFYFVHSYHVRCANPDDILTTTQYGGTFTSSLCHSNILGVQFHPEKSHRFGLELFKNFLAWNPE